MFSPFIGVNSLVVNSTSTPLISNSVSSYPWSGVTSKVTFSPTIPVVLLGVTTPPSLTIVFIVYVSSVGVSLIFAKVTATIFSPSIGVK